MHSPLYQPWGVTLRMHGFGQQGSSLENLIFAQVIKTFWWCCWLNWPFICYIRQNPPRYIPSTPATFARLFRISSSEIIPSVGQGSVPVPCSRLSLVDLSRQKNPEHLGVPFPLKPQRVVGRKGAGRGGILGPLLPLALLSVPRLCLVQQMGCGGRGVTPLPFGEASSSPDTAPAACQKGFINASCSRTRSPSVLPDPRQPGQSTAAAQKSVVARCRGEGACGDGPGPLTSTDGS